MAIITLEQQKHQQIMNQINAILAENRVALSPSVIINPGGMTFKIDLVPSAAHLPKPKISRGGA